MHQLLVSLGKKPRLGSIKDCNRCTKTYYAHPSRANSKFCSRKCNNDTERDKSTSRLLNCETCVTSFTRHPSQIKPLNYCSQLCFNKSQIIPNYEPVTPRSEVGRHGKRMVNGLWSTKKADLEFSHFIRDRDKRTCFFCTKKASQNSHFWGRANSATRYHPENCNYVCGGCHMRHEGSKQGLYREMKIRQLGMPGYEALEKRARSIMKRSHAIAQCMALLSH